MSTLLTFRPFEYKDIDLFCHWKNQKEIWEVDEPGDFQLLKPIEISSWFNPIVDGGNSFIVSVDNKPIGYTGFKVVDKTTNSAEFIIVIGETSYWSQGYGTAMMHWLFELAFEKRQFESLYGYVLGSNQKALRFYESLGFEIIGDFGEKYERFGQRHHIKHIIKNGLITK